MTDTTVRTARDTRGLWRVLLAVVAPLPMLAKGVYYLIIPVDGGADFAATRAAFAAHAGLLDTLKLLDSVFVAGLVPATVAVAWVARRGAPRLATAGALISLTGFLTGISMLGGVLQPAMLAVQHNLDPTAVAGLDEAAANEPVTLIAGLLFIVGIVVGLLLLGIALWRGRGAPAWAGIALAVGGFTHPFLPGHVAQGLGLFVAAAGFAGASMALLRMGNDEFDLAPLRPAG
jgi:hypothetical protein